MSKTETKLETNGRKIQYENERLYLSPGEASLIKVYRAAEGGYQRSLNENRVKQIEADLKQRKAKGRPSNYPEIIVANVNGVLYCIDGQHRLEAHIRAGVEVPAHIMSMSQSEAIDLFVRNNGKARPLRRRDLIVATRAQLGKQIRALAKTHQVSLDQATALVTGLLGGRLPDLTALDSAMTAPEEHAASVVLEMWVKSDKYMLVEHGESGGGRYTEKQRKSVEYTFSSPVTMYALGRVARDTVSNINKLRKDIKLIREADWKKALSDASLRGLARSGANRKKLYEFMRNNVLYPAYREGA